MIGGTEHSIKLLAETLLKRGHEVAIFTIDSNVNKSTIEFINGVKIFRSGNTYFDYKVRFFEKNKSAKKLMMRIIEGCNFKIQKDFDWTLKYFYPDVIHTNNLYGISPYIWELAYKYQIPVLHTLRDYFMLEPNSLVKKNDLFHVYLKKIYKEYFKFFTRYVSGVTAPSSFILMKYLEEGYFQKTEKKRIWNAINIDQEKINQEIMAKKKRKKDKTIYLYVGALLEIKGIYILLEAFNRIKDERVELRICGEGPLKKIVENSVEKNPKIKYLGQLEKKELDIQRKESDVAIISSIWDEPFGRVIIEANEFGLPIIGSNKGGIKEVLEFMKTGILYEAMDINDLVDKILYMKNKENRVAFIENIKEAIVHFDIETQVDQFESMYKKIISKVNLD